MICGIMVYADYRVNQEIGVKNTVKNTVKNCEKN